MKNTHISIRDAEDVLRMFNYMFEKASKQMVQDDYFENPESRFYRLVTSP